MPVFDQHQAIFFHIGKTGGLSIERELGLPACDYRVYQSNLVYGLHEGVMTQHARPGYVKQNIPESKWHDYFKFTIVRNPWDRMVSAFYYLYNINIKRYKDFPGWLMAMHDQVDSKQYREGSHMTPQIEYTHDQGEQIVDYIGRYENLYESFCHVCDKINKPHAELKLINQSGKRPGRDYKSHYSSFTAELVNTMYAEEIKLYQYDL